MKKAIKLVLIILPMLAVVFTLAAGVLVFSLAVISCNKDDYFEGEIIKKEFLEEHYEQRPVITLIYNSTVAVPVTTIWTYHYPKRWRLTVQRTKDEGNHEKQIYVTEECYDAVNVGDWFIYDKSFCSFTEPCEKSKEGEKQ